MSFYRSLHYRILSEVYFASGDLKHAQSSIEEALKLSQKNKEKAVEGTSWGLLGSILGKADISQPLRAEEYIIKGIKILEDIKVKPWASQGYLRLGELYVVTGQKEKALK
jgi:tetratricopeptide (TPR) repeat protein